MQWTLALTAEEHVQQTALYLMYNAAEKSLLKISQHTAL